MKLFWTLHTIWLLLVVGIVAKKGKDGDGDDDHDEGSSTSAVSSTTVDSSSSIPSQTTPSTSSTAPAPSNTTIVTPGLGLKFAAPVNTTTCDSVTFFWTPTGGLESTISLLVTNQGIPEHPPTTNTITETLSESLSSNDQHFTWLHVDVAQGWYVAQARLQNQTVLSQSSAFFVQNGSDVSCLAGINTSSTEGGRPKSSHRHSPQVQHLALGELVGIVVGSAAGVTILAMAFAFPHLWRHALTSPKRKHPYHQLF
ncbi:hypothetical protein VNI00_005960 [Paramarasmius palmivorus]|uniref:Uncharacterized protein n=1 Tax=Paramarasmius palmivorus TaxID=297713 RepID=A0AAW0DF29_9AGAR